MKIALGILCFGDEIYFKGTVNKINKILNKGYNCYILTDSPDFFYKRYTPTYLHVIPYHRKNKSYHDKMILSVHMLKQNDICVLIDADTDIINDKFLDDIRNYNFKDGITYIETLKNHNSNKQYVSELNLDTIEWKEYKNYIEFLYPDYNNLELMWEYFLVINKINFNYDKFFKIYEKLQLCKEYCELKLNKDVIGAGEGISIQISSILSETPIQRDSDLYEILKDKIKGISLRYTPKNQLPDWTK
jgi:hypothetical protein